MVNNILGDWFTNEFEKVDQFFHRKLREAKITLNFEDLKQELVQRTAEAVLIKLQSEKYSDFHLNSLIWLKATDTWKFYMRSLKRRGPQMVTTESVFHLPAEDDLAAAYEMADWLLSIRDRIGSQKWQMLIMHLEGFPDKEIGERCGMSEVAVRVALHRLRSKLQRPH